MRTSVFAQVGDVGVQIVVQLVDQSGTIIDVSGATALTIKLGYPDRVTTADKTATLFTDGHDGKIAYTTQTGDLSEAGLWEVQGKVTLAGKPVSSRVGFLQVFDNVDES